MELNQNSVGEYNTINKVSDDNIIINQKSHNQSCILSNNNLLLNLNLSSIDDITEIHIKQLLLTEPEIVLFGSGNVHQFPNIELLNPIAKLGIGFEVMNNKSAARTYNVLIAEERKVACLLILKNTPIY